MKRLLFLLTAMLTFSGMWAQCPTGNVTLTTQQQINNFATTYPNCTEIVGWLRIDGSDINDLSLLGNITSIGGYLRIFNTNNLVNLTGLENLTSIDEDLRIIDNTALTDITALNNLSTGITGLRIQENPQLSVCNINPICEHITNDGSISIYANAPGCNSVITTEISCLAPSGDICYTGNLNLTTQQEIDDFSINYPNCDVILGQLRIRGTTPDAITNLNGLSQLKVIRGDLVVVANDIPDFTGLDNVTFVGGEFKINNVDQITDFTGLDNLNFIYGDANIESNNLLANMSGLENLTHVRKLNLGSNTSLTTLDGLDNLSYSQDITINNNALTSIAALSNLSNAIRFLHISDNAALASLAGLENIMSPIRNISLSGNGSLADISALGNITEANYIYIHNNNNLTTLTGLNNLTSVTENIYVSNNNMLIDLSGLESLTNVNSGVSVISNPALTSIEGLSNLSSVSNITIGNNNILGSLIGLENLSSIITINIQGNDALTNLTGIQNISTITGNLDIFNNDALVDITAVSNITATGIKLRISENAILDNLNGLENLTSVGTELRIEGNPMLTNLDPLENVSSVGTSLKISTNASLTDITGIQNIDPNSFTQLSLFNNPNLSFCDLDNICTYLENGGTNSIFTNATGCNNQSEVEQACNTPDPVCPSGNITFVSQQEIDDFPTNYPGCTVIDGTLYIDEDVTDLSGLNQLTTINGDLNLDFYSSLTDFSGLENLEIIGGNFRVNSAYELINFEGLESLTTIGGGFEVSTNNNLNNLSGLENLTSIGGDFDLFSNWSLINITGLEGLMSISGRFIIDGNDELENLNGLNDLSVIGGSLSLSSYSLADISALSNLISIGGMLYCQGTKLSSLSGLENLNSVGGELYFYLNDQLMSLSGLESLTSIGGKLTLWSNDALTDLAGIANIDHTTITDLSIVSNISLSVCGVSSICNYLAAGGTSDISDNLLGCNNQSEVESVCNSDTDCTSEVSEDITEIFDEDLFIDGVGFANNPNINFTNSAIPNGAVLSDVSLELYFRLNGSSCENEIAIQITDPAGNTQPLTAYTTCDGGTGLYYVNLDVTNVTASTGVNNWLIEFDDTNDQNTDYEYSVRFARLKYTSTTVGSATIVNEVSDFADSDLFIDGIGFENNGTYTFADPGTPADAVLSDISLELYFRLNGSSCENEIALQITNPAGNTQPLTAYTTCDGGTGLFYVNLDVPSGSTIGSIADWVVEFDDTNDQNTDYEYSVRFGRLTYTTTYTTGGSGSGTPVTVNDQISEDADMDLFIDGVGFANNDTYTFTDPGIPADGILSNISLELYFRLNGNSCENEIALQITDPAGNTQPLTAYTTCDGGNGLFYVNLDVPSGSTTGSVADWVVEFDDTNDQNTDYEYSVRFGRLTYDVEYTECVPMLVSENNNAEQQVNNSSTHQFTKNNNSSTRQPNNSLKLYPVPASQHLNVEYFSENTNPTNIEIISNEGKILMSSQEFSQEGINTIQLDIADLPAGHYHIRMYNADDMQMQSFVKIAP